VLESALFAVLGEILRLKRFVGTNLKALGFLKHCKHSFFDFQSGLAFRNKSSALGLQVFCYEYLVFKAYADIQELLDLDICKALFCFFN